MNDSTSPAEPPASESSPAVPAATVPRHFLAVFVMLTTLFALWGLGNNLTDTLLAAFKKSMSMTDFQTSWIQVAFYGSYFCLAFPAALFMRRFSYKAGVLLGLTMFAVGALGFYPASQTMEYSHFLIALFVLAGGLAILETAANPCILALGPSQTATRRLNLAQAFNPLGSITGVAIGAFLILPKLNPASESERAVMEPAELEAIQSGELAAVMGPYVALACLAVLLLIGLAVFRFPKNIDAGGELTGDRLKHSLGRLLSRRRYVLGVVAQFFYVGAQIGVWSYTIRYVMTNLEVNEEIAGRWYLASIIAFSVSRFVCTALMGALRPAVMLWLLAGAGVVCCLVATGSTGVLGCVALVACSMCMSLMFPTIYGVALDGLDEDRKLGASGLVMAILGGAVLTALQGLVSDAAGSIHVAFLVPAGCFAVVAVFGLVVSRGEADQSDDNLEKLA